MLNEKQKGIEKIGTIELWKSTDGKNYNPSISLGDCTSSFTKEKLLFIKLKSYNDYINDNLFEILRNCVTEKIMFKFKEISKKEVWLIHGVIKSLTIYDKSVSLFFEVSNMYLTDSSNKTIVNSSYSSIFPILRRKLTMGK